MISAFEELIRELGLYLRLNLHLDRYGACTIQSRPHFAIQMQLDETEENLWVFAPIAETPPGKFRENIFKEALKYNFILEESVGTLGYINQQNQLALFQRFPLQLLSAERLAHILGAFFELGSSWQEAIDSGQSAPIEILKKTMPQ